ncbi:chitinase-3-like protein 2 [Paramacrobiotus metropolitanus]|uniref:chitinase-3-like protein 2 n=1 Tax=Paramacrobiotus metropolitanus TaxID=2943436 RepID=UPI0024457510|nr:chitinase-3-like protein 2 [Paramacrobiotus metropolitanus]
MHQHPWVIKYCWMVAVIWIGYIGQSECTLKVQCYLASWSLNNNANTSFRISDINPNGGCDVIIYAFFKLVDNRFEPPDGNKFRGHFQQLSDLKLKNPYLKIILSVGGWSFSTNFSSTAGNDSSRAALVGSVVRDLRKWGMDGLDVDWEFPEEKDRESYMALLKDLRYAFESDADATKQPRLALSAAVSNQVLPGYNVAEMKRYLDIVNVMTYDYRGLWGKDNITGYNAGMPDVEASMNAWMTAGIPAPQLAVGIPFYARSWTLSGSFIPDSAAVGHPASGPGQAGILSKEPGILVYAEYCPALNPGWTVQVNRSNQIVQARKNDQWINYDDFATIKTKVLWATEHNFHSVFIWHLGQDDIYGRCKTGRSPLLTTIAETINPPAVTIPPPTTVPAEIIVTTTSKPWKPRSRASTTSPSTSAIVTLATVSLLLTGMVGTVAVPHTRRPTYTTTKTTTVPTTTTTALLRKTSTYTTATTTTIPSTVSSTLVTSPLPFSTEIPTEIVTMITNITQAVTVTNATQTDIVNEVNSLVTLPVTVFAPVTEPETTTVNATEITTLLPMVAITQPEDYDRPYDTVTEPSPLTSTMLTPAETVPNSTTIAHTIKPTHGGAALLNKNNIMVLACILAAMFCSSL